MLYVTKVIDTENAPTGTRPVRIIIFNTRINARRLDVIEVCTVRERADMHISICIREGAPVRVLRRLRRRAVERPRKARRRDVLRELRIAVAIKNGGFVHDRSGASVRPVSPAILARINRFVAAVSRRNFQRAFVVLAVHANTRIVIDSHSTESEISRAAVRSCSVYSSRRRRVLTLINIYINTNVARAVKISGARGVASNTNSVY